MQYFLLQSPLNDPTTKWVMVGVAAATVLYAVVRPAMRKKDPLNKPRSAASLAQQRNVERQMSNLLVELSEMARQLTAQLDTRTQKLELLLQEADEKIAALQRCNSATSTPDFRVNSDSRISPAERAVLTMTPEPERPAIDPRHQEVYALADQGQPAADIARRLNRPRGEVELILALRPRG